MKAFILVAGVDYPFKGTKKWAARFGRNCINRMKRVIAANKTNEDLTFKIFDFPKGKVITHEITFAGRKKIEKVTTLTPSPYKPITRRNYLPPGHPDNRFTEHMFKNGQRDKMSIRDIYKAVQQVGKDAPGTLAELSFFSHGFMGGPILVNSDNDRMNSLVSPRLGGLPANSRDPDDMDPRGGMDFEAPTMDPRALDSFQKAFHSDGFIWIWGCGFPGLFHQVLYKIERHPSYRDSGIGDDVIFKFTNMNTAQVNDLEEEIKDALGNPFPDKKQIEVKFKYLKYYVCRYITASYAHQIAKRAKVKTFAALMGTWTEQDSGVLPLMHVHNAKYVRKRIKFYKNYLGINFDPEGRNYGEYTPGFACTPPSP